MSKYFHCPKCGKNWTHQGFHPDCDAAPHELVECRTFEPVTPLDWTNSILACVVEIVLWCYLYSFSAWLLLVPLFWWLKGLLVEKSQQRIADFFICQIRQMIRRKDGAK